MTYVPSGNPPQGSGVNSGPIRAEFAAIGAAFTVFPRITTTGLFDTVFAQVGSFTFTLPSAPGTLAMVSDVAAETTARTTAITAETTRAMAAEAQALNNVGRNYVHNALFNIQQRGGGPFVAVTTGWTYSLDRWQVIISAGGDACNHATVALTDTNRVQIGDESAVNALVVNFSGGSGTANACLSSQFIEGVRRLAGKTVTVSFYAIASASLKLGVSLDQFFGSGGSPSASVAGVGQSVTLSTTWARYSRTFTVPSTSSKILGTAGNDQTSLMFWHSAGSNSATRSGSVGVQSGTHEIWGVQLEVAPTASLLEKLDIGLDAANCQRFFQLGAAGAFGYNTTGNIVGAFSTYSQTMRTIPTVTLGATLITSNASSVTVDTITQWGFRIFFTAASTGTVSGLNTYFASADL